MMFKVNASLTVVTYEHHLRSQYVYSQATYLFTSVKSFVAQVLEEFRCFVIDQEIWIYSLRVHLYNLQIITQFYLNSIDT